MSKQLWNQTIYNFKKRNWKDTIRTTFTYFGNKTIKKLEPSCHCLTIKQNKNHIEVSFKPNKPNNGEYETFKYVTLTFDDGSQLDLQIEGTITL